MSTLGSAPALGYRSPLDARHVPITAGRALALEAAAAAEVRAYQTDPAVVALRVEQIRTQVGWLMWTGIGLGLCFTMTSVQQFAAAGAPVGSLAWCAAWLLDPTVSLVLLAVLRAEQVTARWQVPTGPWPRAAKWALLAATYVMNTWASWATGSVAGVVLHSVPPLVVVLAAETVTDLHHALTSAAHTAATHHTPAPPSVPATRTDAGSGGGPLGYPRDPSPGEWGVTASGERPVGVPGGLPVALAGEHRGGWSVTAPGPGAERAPGQAGEHREVPPVTPPGPGGERATRPAREPRRQPVARPPGRRRVLADYVALARAAWAPGVVVTPAWARRVTGCSRGLSPKVAAALTTAPPPPALTGTARTAPEEGAA